MAKRVLVLAATTGYQTRVFEETARRIGFEVTMATDRCHRLEDPWGDNAIPVRFSEPESSAATLAESVSPDGVIAVGDRPTEIAALTAARLGLRFHPPHSVAACRNKFLTHERLRRAGLPVADYFRVPIASGYAEALRSVRFPCVLKPLTLSASRGVIRANNETEFVDAFRRIRAILSQPDIPNDEDNKLIQVETYIPGREFALEGLAIAGHLKVLALFDKPEPLQGPFFEETIYTTPSRESAEVQGEIRRTAQGAVTALGLTDGPIHAEMRANESGVYMLEVAARPIGGLCAQCLRFDADMSLEEVLLRSAAGEDVRSVKRESAASGVMMIPIPANGIYSSAAGIDDAREVPGVTEVVITAKQGQRMLRLPEGASYLGFIFARGENPREVEGALRQAHALLRFEFLAELPALRPCVDIRDR